MKSCVSPLSFLLALVLSATALADFRISVLTGIGPSSVASGGDSQSLGSLAVSLVGEKVLSSRFALSVEHQRALDGSTNFTGASWRWYVMRAMPWPLLEDEIVSTAWYQKTFSPYIGLGGGYAHARLGASPDGQTLSASGMYLAARVGVEYPLSGVMSAKLEGFYLRSIGGSSIRSLGGLVGVVWNLR